MNRDRYIERGIATVTLAIGAALGGIALDTAMSLGRDITVGHLCENGSLSPKVCGAPEGRATAKRDLEIQEIEMPLEFAAGGILTSFAGGLLVFRQSPER